MKHCVLPKGTLRSKDCPGFVCLLSLFGLSCKALVSFAKDLVRLRVYFGTRFDPTPKFFCQMCTNSCHAPGKNFVTKLALYSWILVHVLKNNDLIHFLELRCVLLVIYWHGCRLNTCRT